MTLLPYNTLVLDTLSSTLRQSFPIHRHASKSPDYNAASVTSVWISYRGTSTFVPTSNMLCNAVVDVHSLLCISGWVQYLVLNLHQKYTTVFLRASVHTILVTVNTHTSAAHEDPHLPSATTGPISFIVDCRNLVRLFVKHCTVYACACATQLFHVTISFVDYTARITDLRLPAFRHQLHRNVPASCNLRSCRKTHSVILYCCTCRSK